MVGTLVRRIPEDVSILNKFWHAVVDKRASKDGDWTAFRDGGKDALGSIG